MSADTDHDKLQLHVPLSDSLVVPLEPPISWHDTAHLTPFNFGATSVNQLVQPSPEYCPSLEYVISKPQNVIFKDEALFGVTVDTNLIDRNAGVFHLSNAQSLLIDQGDSLKVSSAISSLTNLTAGNSVIAKSYPNEGSPLFISPKSQLTSLGLEPLKAGIYEHQLLPESSAIHKDSTLVVSPFMNIQNKDAALYCVTSPDNVFATDLSIVGRFNSNSLLTDDTSILKLQADDTIRIDIGSANMFSLDQSITAATILRTQDLLPSFRVSELGCVVTTEDRWKFSLQDKFLGLSSSYSALLSRPTNEEYFTQSGLARFLKSSASEYLYETNLTATVSSKFLPEHLEDDIENDQEERYDKILEELEVVDSRMPSMLIGARQALESKNVERTRHFAVSLRELFTHVLHTLSPDKKVKNWTSNPDHYANGRPPRRARLLYICRTIDSREFEAFLKSDVDSVLTFINLFQSGTHNIRPGFTDIQLKAMLLRMEATLQYLLEISRG